MAFFEGKVDLLTNWIGDLRIDKGAFVNFWPEQYVQWKDHFKNDH